MRYQLLAARCKWLPSARAWPLSAGVPVCSVSSRAPLADSTYTVVPFAIVRATTSFSPASAPRVRRAMV